ncbi:protein kinase domain-containing protein [Floridanema aerugineum]|uniref:non-specific serine/threonine protein kinase n=1 Tax=Floridaenema aerugineum BLCC-F46 TaxID=3153654 RepID=A0ABV4X395_9CYAN
MTNFSAFSSHGYQIIRELGRNREGGRITYLATHLSQKQQVVIKQFCFAQSGSSWSGFKAYEREIELLKKLNHSGIPRYLDSFENRDGFCLVQEYKNARSLGEIRPLKPEQIKQIAVAALEILVELQNYIPPVFHRDIKPENILVDEHLNVYLIDFGFSCLGGKASSESSIIAGTPGFMPPEHLHELTKSSDIYSLGATLICLLTGKTTTTIQDLLDKRDRYRIRFQKQIPEHINPRFISWLEKMVEPDLKKRFTNATSALKALKPIPIERSAKSELLTKIKVGLSLLATSAISLVGLAKGPEIYLHFVSNSTVNNITSGSSQPIAPPIPSNTVNSNPLPTSTPGLEEKNFSNQPIPTTTPTNNAESSSQAINPSQLDNQTKKEQTDNSISSSTVDPGNTLSKALDIGTLKDNRTYNDFVGSVDLDDYYRFNLDTTSNFQLSLSGLSEYTYVQLILDRNGNEQLERDEVLYANSSSSSTGINRPLGAGTYFIRVFPSDRNNNTKYTLEVSTTPVQTNSVDPGNTLGKALNIGNLKETRTYNDFVGSVDPEDYYRFNLDSTSNVQLSLSSLSEYTYVQLILDRNNNGQLERDEILYANSSSSSTAINRPLGAGTYFIRVFPSERNNNTIYTLEVSATGTSTN